VLWVKGSGGDVGSMKLDGFSTLYMDKLNALQGIYRGPEPMKMKWWAYLPHCTFNLNPRAASIDTPLACATCRLPMWITCILIRSSRLRPWRTAEQLPSKLFGGTIGWLPWRQVPAMSSGLQLQRYHGGASRPERGSGTWQVTGYSLGAMTPAAATRTPWR